MENKQGTGSTSGSADSGAAAFMAELFQKFGGAEKAMEAFAMFATAMGKSVQATPSSSVPQPEAVSEPVADTDTVQEAIAILEPTAVPEEIVVPETTTQPEDIPESTTTSPEPTTAGNREDDSDLVTGLELLAMSESRLDSVTEGETPVSFSVSEGVTPVLASEEYVERDVLEPSEEIRDFVADVSVSEGGTPVLEESVGEEAPIVGEDGGDEALNSEQDVVAGRTPEKPVGAEAHIGEGFEGVETPVYISGATPLLSKEGEALDSELSQEPADAGVKLIVDLTEIPEETDSPVNPRDARRRARRSLLDEIDETVEPTEEELLGPETAASEQEKSPRPSRGESDAEERRQAAEKKRKGKQIAPSSTKKARGKSTESTLPPAAKVPYAAETESPSESSDSEEEQEEEFNFEPTEVWITNSLLDEMRTFDDPKRTAIYKEKSTEGKVAKSGKMYSSSELKTIACNEEFRTYIDAIGFEWLLKHSTTEVPIDLAREFFSTFRFKSTTDLDAESINFRLFNEEYTMSIREWTLRMGLLTRTEDDEGLWSERMIGQPKMTPGFKAQSAWEFLTHPRVGQFKTSFSKAHHIENRVLRFAQTFISYNLMGTANNALTTADLYFTWCMATGVRVHLGYWIAQACHQVTANPSRHLYTCHLLGAYLQRNVIMKIHKACREVKTCSPPEVFNMDYFFNKGLLIARGREVCFYEVGQSETQVKQEHDVVEARSTADVEAGAMIGVEEVRTEIGWMRTEMKMVLEGIVSLRGKSKNSAETESVRKDVAGVRAELEEIRTEVGKVREEMVALKGRMSDLVTTSTRCTAKMTEGVELMMAMTKWLRARFPETPKELPKTSGDSTTPGQGSLTAQKPPHAPRPQTTPSPSRPVILKTTVPRPTEVRQEKPELPARKKAKVTHQTAPPQSGPRGGQTPN